MTGEVKAKLAFDRASRVSVGGFLRNPRDGSPPIDWTAFGRVTESLQIQIGARRRIRQLQIRNPNSQILNNPSRQHTLHQFPMHVGQPVVAALVAECQAGVVDAQQVQHCGVQVMNVNGVFHDVV